MGETDRITAPPVEVYPKAPLRAVAVEVYFNGVLNALGRFDEFQRRHAEEFPSLFLPRRADDDGDDPLRPALLLGPKSERAMAVAPNQLAAITYGYAGGVAAFLAWATPFLHEGLQIIQPVGGLTRVRYRYENVIDRGARGDLDLNELFDIHLPRHEEALPAVRNDLYLGWRQAWPLGTVSVDISVDSLPAASSDTIVVNIAAERTGPIDEGALDDRIHEAHHMARWTFERLITPAYRTRLREGS